MTGAILLIGANGQVGRELKNKLPRLGEVTSLDRQKLDLARPEEIRRAIRSFRGALIVNAAGYTAVGKAESEQASARRVIADAPAVRTQETNRSGDCLVHSCTC